MSDKIETWKDLKDEISALKSKILRMEVSGVKAAEHYWDLREERDRLRAALHRIVEDWNEHSEVQWAKKIAREALADGTEGK